MTDETEVKITVQEPTPFILTICGIKIPLTDEQVTAICRYTADLDNLYFPGVGTWFKSYVNNQGSYSITRAEDEKENEITEALIEAEKILQKAINDLDEVQKLIKKGGEK